MAVLQCVCDACVISAEPSMYEWRVNLNAILCTQ